MEPYPLSTIQEILECIDKKKGVRVDIGRIPIDDKKTLDLFKNGDTEGVFGFGSADMQKYLKALQPNTFNDLMNLCALYGLEGMFRPATFEMLPKYIAIKTGKNKVDNIHPDAAPIISPTCGMLAKRNPEQISKIEPEFFCRCETQGYDKKTVSKFWNLIFPYSGFVGRKTLVSIYTFVAYQFAYLKAHYKSEFYSIIT